MATQVAGESPASIHMCEKQLESTVSQASATVVHTSVSAHYGDWPNDLGFDYEIDHPTPTKLQVKGRIPAWAAGTLLRTGPSQYKVPASDKGDRGFTVAHWFDGFTRLHKFEMKPTSDSAGSATDVYYSSRTQVDALLEKARKSGRLDGVTFAQGRDPCDSFYQKIKSTFSPFVRSSEPEMVNTGVAIYDALHGYGNDRANVLSLTTDATTLREFDLESLEGLSVTVQKQLHPELKGSLSAAHPSVCPATGDQYNYNLEPGAKSTYRVFREKADGSGVDILAAIIGPRAAYLHSLLLTEHYVVLSVWPAYYKANGASILWERNILDAIEPTNAEIMTCDWLVIDRTGMHGVVKHFTSPAMFCFHTTNAWEEMQADGTVNIIAELCQFKDTSVLHRFYYDNLVSTSKNVAAYQGPGKKADVSLVRYRLAGIQNASAGGKKSNVYKSNRRDRQSLDVAEQIMQMQEPYAGDLPRINAAFATKPHRYVYSVVNRGLSSFLDGLCKSDTQTQTAKLWSCEKHTPGEPIFIARPGGIDEDDGVLLSVVLDGSRGSSYLLCLDARTMEEVGRAECKSPVGFGFHGIHLPYVAVDL